MARNMICSFCGHRICSEHLRNKIKELVTDLIVNHRVDTFYSGGMGNFDNMCESVVRELKKEYTKIKLYLILPYMIQNLNNDPEYYRYNYDDVIIPDIGDVHYKRAIPERNKWLVDNSDYMICLINRTFGGAYTTYEYAKKSDVTIIDV